MAVDDLDPIPPGDRSTAAIDAAEALLLAGHDALEEGVLIADGQRLLRANDTACSLLGIDRDHLVASPTPWDLFPPEERDRIRAAVEPAAGAGDGSTGHHQALVARPDGSSVVVDLAVTTVAATWTRTVVLLRDVSDRRRSQEQLVFEALHDPLTGLANRCYLEDHLDHLLARAIREPVTAGLLFVGLDGFAAVNDRYGRHAGDRVLAEVGDASSGTCAPVTSPLAWAATSSSSCASTSVPTRPTVWRRASPRSSPYRSTSVRPSSRSAPASGSTSSMAEVPT